MKKTKLGISLIMMVIVASMATAFRKPADDKGFKNLKVLPKDISKAKLDSIMDFYKLALGVKCNHCHAKNKDTSNHHLDFASDDKREKETARKMMRMTADLNSKYFDGKHRKGEEVNEVSCFTCHRGTVEPDMHNLMPQIKTLQEEDRKRHEEEKKKRGNR